MPTLREREDSYISGTKAGALKAKMTIIQNQFNGDEEAYRASRAKLGSKGGKISRGGGFTNNPELAARAGRLGGMKSRKKKVL